jgi:hypothetical protein
MAFDAWFEDTAGNEHPATWHRREHGNQPMPPLDEDYPPEDGESEVIE